MTIKGLLKALTIWTGNGAKEYASMLGLKKQAYYRRFNGSMKADELFKLMDRCGFDLCLYNRETGEAWIYQEAHGQQICGMYHGHIYNTGMSIPVAYDGNGHELFKDSNGEFIMADYEKRRVEAVAESVAESFLSQYGNLKKVTRVY